MTEAWLYLDRANYRLVLTDSEGTELGWTLVDPDVIRPEVDFILNGKTLYECLRYPVEIILPQIVSPGEPPVKFQVDYVITSEGELR